MSKFIGVDVGASGAVAIITSSEYAVERTPNWIKQTKSRKRNKKTGEMEDKIKNSTKIDQLKFIELVQALYSKHGPNTKAIVEQVQMMPDQSVQSMENLIGTYHFQRAVFLTVGFEVVDVRPQKWKKHFGLINGSLTPSKRKALALNKARELFPDAPLPLAKDHDLGEALLIAQYGKDLLG